MRAIPRFSTTPYAYKTQTHKLPVRKLVKNTRMSVATTGPLPTPAPGDVWYFAFGSNMNPTVLTGRRKVHPKASVPATLDGYVLGFNYRSVPYVEPGMATVLKVTPLEAAKAKQHLASLPTGSDGKPQILTSQDAHAARVAAGLHGVAHLISASEWEMVKGTEGVALQGIGYQIVRVTLDAYNGLGKLDSVTLAAAPLSCTDPSKVVPSLRYMTLIRDGARTHGLDPAYCAMLEAHPVFSPPTDWGQKVGKIAMAGLAMGVAIPFLPVVLASATVASVKDWWQGKPTHTHPAAAPGATSNTLPPEQPPSPSLSTAAQPAANGPQTTSSDLTSTTSTVVGITDQSSSSVSFQTTKPPTGAAVLMWMRQYVNAGYVAAFMFSAMLSMNVAHDWVLEPLLGSGLSNNSIVAKQKRSQKKLT